MCEKKALESSAKYAKEVEEYEALHGPIMKRRRARDSRAINSMKK